MKVYLLRHGETAWNAEKRYLGCRTDQPLSAPGRAALVPADFAPERLVVSPLLRCRQTASILFPNTAQQQDEGLREMDFGAFEGRTADEMAADADYRAWVDRLCAGPCPGGEDMDAFAQRSADAFLRQVQKALADGCASLAVVAHGGTVMAVMSRLFRPEKPYFQWYARNGCGWSFAADAVPFTVTQAQPLCFVKNWQAQETTDGRPR